MTRGLCCTEGGERGRPHQNSGSDTHTHTPPGPNDSHAPRPPGCSAKGHPSRNETRRKKAACPPPPPLLVPFLAPSGAAPADALLATFPMDTSPLTLATPPPFFRRRRGRTRRRVVRTPLRATQSPLKTIQSSTAYDDHPDCAVFPVVKNHRAPTRRTPAHRCPPLLAAERGPTEVASEQGPSTPLGPRHLTGAEGARGGGPRWGRVGDLPGGGGRPPPERYLPSPYIYPFSDFG